MRNGQFSTDEVTAATRTLQSRFNDAVSPHVVIARHTGDYASLYAAASDYLDQAGSDERQRRPGKIRSRPCWRAWRAARASFGKAPVTGNDADPVSALLDKAPAQTSTPRIQARTALVTNARAMLDAQAGSARDNGKDLVFTGGRQTGQQVDFTDFDNRTLAIMALNADASFSAPEASAAKAELNQRTRSSLVNAFGGDGIRASSPGAAPAIFEA